jgi:predicted transcriptional regulator
MTAELIEMTTDIVSSFVRANQISPADLPALIKSTYQTLSTLDAPAEDIPAPLQIAKPTTAQIKKSIKPEGLVSFEDGKTYKTLKRHLTRHGLTFAAYREKWGLPNDYPATAPVYSAMRSDLAKSLGLGRKAAEPAPNPAPKARRAEAKA